MLRTLLRRRPGSSLASSAADTIVVHSILGGVPLDVATTGSLVVVCERPPCSAVASALESGYREAFPSASFITFQPDTFLDELSSIAAPNAVIVLIQDHAFQNLTRTYRLRLKLWDLGYRVAEHVHLLNVVEPDATPALEKATINSYLEACCLDPKACEAHGTQIATALNDCSEGIIVESTLGSQLVYGGRLETCLLNTGNYHEGASSAEAEDAPDPSSPSSKQQRAVGGSYPFGEVITESRRLSDVSGTATLFAFPNRERRLHSLADCQRFTIEVRKGVVIGTSPDTPAEFMELLELVRAVEGDAVLRELGIGLNPALGKGRIVGDITAFERQWGVHVSLGKRHPLFIKSSSPESIRPDDAPYDHLRRKDGKLHLDLFIDATKIIDRRTGGTVVDFTHPSP